MDYEAITKDAVYVHYEADELSVPTEDLIYGDKEAVSVFLNTVMTDLSEEGFIPLQANLGISVRQTMDEEGRPDGIEAVIEGVGFKKKKDPSPDVEIDYPVPGTDDDTVKDYYADFSMHSLSGCMYALKCLLPYHVKNASVWKLDDMYYLFTTLYMKKKDIFRSAVPLFDERINSVPAIEEGVVREHGIEIVSSQNMENVFFSFFA